MGPFFTVLVKTAHKYFPSKYFSNGSQSEAFQDKARGGTVILEAEIETKNTASTKFECQ